MIDNPFQDLEQSLVDKADNALVTAKTLRILIAAAKKGLTIPGDGITIDCNTDGRKVGLAKDQKKARGTSGSFKVCVHDPAWSGQDKYYSRTIKWVDGLITTSGNKVIEIYTQDTHTVEAGHEPAGDGEIGDGSDDYDSGYGNIARPLNSNKAIDLAL